MTQAINGPSPASANSLDLPTGGQNLPKRPATYYESTIQTVSYPFKMVAYCFKTTVLVVDRFVSSIFKMVFYPFISHYKVTICSEELENDIKLIRDNKTGSETCMHIFCTRVFDATSNEGNIKGVLPLVEAFSQSEPKRFQEITSCIPALKEAVKKDPLKALKKGTLAFKELFLGLNLYRIRFADTQETVEMLLNFSAVTRLNTSQITKLQTVFEALRSEKPGLYELIAKKLLSCSERVKAEAKPGETEGDTAMKWINHLSQTSSRDPLQRALEQVWLHLRMEKIKGEHPFEKLKTIQSFEVFPSSKRRLMVQAILRRLPKEDPIRDSFFRALIEADEALKTGLYAEACQDPNWEVQEDFDPATAVINWVSSSAFNLDVVKNAADALSPVTICEEFKKADISDTKKLYVLYSGALHIYDPEKFAEIFNAFLKSSNSECVNKFFPRLQEAILEKTPEDKKLQKKTELETIRRKGFDASIQAEEEVNDFSTNICDVSLNVLASFIEEDLQSGNPEVVREALEVLCKEILGKESTNRAILKKHLECANDSSKFLGRLAVFIADDPVHASEPGVRAYVEKGDELLEEAKRQTASGWRQTLQYGVSLVWSGPTEEERRVNAYQTAFLEYLKNSENPQDYGWLLFGLSHMPKTA